MEKHGLPNAKQTIFVAAKALESAIEGCGKDEGEVKSLLKNISRKLINSMGRDESYQAYAEALRGVSEKCQSESVKLDIDAAIDLLKKGSDMLINEIKDEVEDILKKTLNLGLYSNFSNMFNIDLVELYYKIAK